MADCKALQPTSSTLSIKLIATCVLDSMSSTNCTNPDVPLIEVASAVW